LIKSNGEGKALAVPIILRSNAARAWAAIGFGFMCLVFLLDAFSRPSVSQLPFVGVVVTAVAAVRGLRGGYVAVYPDRIVVRTLARTRAFALIDIASMEIETYLQFTTRVRPVLLFKDGSKYKISEFFMQKRLYERDLASNKITKLVGTISQLLT
jgi:hypothetical protein